MSEYDLGTIWLARGAHPSSGDGCVMEWVALLAGLEKTDEPDCTNAFVTRVAIFLNDSLADDARQGLKRCIPALVDARRTPDDDWVDRMLAQWCARSLPAPTEDRFRRLHGVALRAATDYREGRIDEEACRAAASTAAEAGAQIQSIALYVAADAALAAVAPDPQPAIINAGTGAADWALKAGVAVEWFAGLLAAHGTIVRSEEMACCPG